MNKLFSPAEAKRFYAIGMPILVAQLSQTGMTFADTAMTGQYNAEDMAAIAVAGSIWAPVALFGVGCLLALPALGAQMVGAGKTGRTAHLLRQGIWLSLAVSIAVIGLFWALSFHLAVFGLEARLAALAGSYLRALLWGFPAFMFFVNQRSFFEGYSRTRPAMVIGLLGLLLNVPLNYVMIYGRLGLPALGAVGCGIASSVCYWFMALAMMYYLRKDPQFRRLRPIFSPFRKNRAPDEPALDLPLVWRAFRIGLPSAIALFFEVSLFALSTVLLAPLGTVVVAAHQIALNFGAMVFMVPLAIGMTATIRVGYCLGHRSIPRARVTAMTGLCLSVVFAILTGVACIVFRHGIVMIYNTDPAIVALSMELLVYLGAYQLVDGLQMVGIGVLRGYNDTRIISVICFVGYWFIGLPLGYILARTDLLAPAMGAAGFWVAFLAALGFCALGYWLRVRYLHSLAPDEIMARVKR